MATFDTIDMVQFRQMFPAFQSGMRFPDPMIEAYYAVAGSYIDQAENPSGLNGSTLQWALQLMTAHLLFIADKSGSGQQSGIKTSASTGDVSVSWQAPEAKGSWKYWLNQSSYGQQLLALLSAKSVGGWTVGGRPETQVLRRIGNGWR